MHNYELKLMPRLPPFGITQIGEHLRRGQRSQQLLKIPQKPSAFCGIRNFSTIVTRVRIQSQMNPIYKPHSISSRSIFILPCSGRVGFLQGLAFSALSCITPRPSYPPPSCDLINLILRREMQMDAPYYVVCFLTSRKSE